MSVAYRGVTHQFLEPASGVSCDVSMLHRRQAPMRVLVLDHDAEVRDAYQRILRETKISHDIAVFRAPRSPLTQSPQWESSNAHSSLRMPGFEPLCCNRAEEAIALVQEAAVQHQPFTVAFIDV